MSPATYWRAAAHSAVPAAPAATLRCDVRARERGRRRAPAAQRGYWGVEPPVTDAHDGFMRVVSLAGRGTRGGNKDEAVSDMLKQEAIVGQIRLLLSQLEVLGVVNRQAPESPETPVGASGGTPGGAGDAPAGDAIKVSV